MAKNEKRIKRRIRNAYIVSTVSVALVLFILGSVGYLILNARQASDRIRERVTLSVFLRDDISSEERQYISAKLDEMEAVKEVKYLSKDDAAAEFKAYAGQDFEGFLEGNPLPASYEVTLNADYSVPDSLKTVETAMRRWDGVDDILYQEAIIGQVTDNIYKFNLVLLLFGGTLLLISLILINNTIRMSIFAKRFIINTMRLVGATRWFIMKPFLGRAVLQGIYAGLIASALMAGVVIGLNRGIPEAGFLTGNVLLAEIFGGLIVAGILIATVFTWTAVRKYARLNTTRLHLY